VFGEVIMNGEDSCLVDLVVDTLEKQFPGPNSALEYLHREFGAPKY